MTIDDQFAICYSNDQVIAKDLCELDGRVSDRLDRLERTIIAQNNTIQMLQRALAASNKALGVNPVEPYAQRIKEVPVKTRNRTINLKNPTCTSCQS